MRSPHSSERFAPSSDQRSTSRISTECLIDAKKFARKRRFSCRREVHILPGASRPHQIRGRLRVYHRNGFQTRKNTHETGIPPRDAKSSSSRALRALIKSVVDFACIIETAYIREKVRTREPFLPEKRSHPSFKPAELLSDQRSTSRVSSKRLAAAYNYARNSRFCYMRKAPLSLLMNCFPLSDFKEKCQCFLNS